ncbi:MAG: AraC family transcriptional regulator [Clostridiales bacterium]|nr:AraC family transcriptional regulator [Clostridiales bacterium]
MQEILFIPLVENFVFRECSPGWVLKRQLTSLHALVYVTEGQGEFAIDDVVYPAARGDLLYFPPGVWREVTADAKKPFRYYAFEFQLFDEQFHPTKLPLPLHNRIGQDVKLEHILIRVRQAWALRESSCRMQVTALLMECLCHLMYITGLRQGAGSDPRIQKAAAFVTENVSRHLSAAEIGEAVGLHPGYLNKLTLKHTGMTASRFVTSIRVNMAEDAIIYEGISIGEAARRFGFSDIYHFSKVFKKFKGYTPSTVKMLKR